VGALALLRVLPPLAGFLGTGGVPLAAAVLPGRITQRGTQPSPHVAGAPAPLDRCLGAVGWVAITPLIAHPLLPELGLGMVAFTGVLVLSQMAV